MSKQPKIKQLLSLLLCLALWPTAPAALAEESVQVRTPLDQASAAARSNVELAASSISGMTIAYGDTFSFNDAVGPRSEKYGYQSACNGRGAKVIGGGVAQVASTLYMALQEAGADVDYTDFNTYGDSFVQSYVDDAADAVMVDYAADYDFAFVSYEDDMYLELWTTQSYLYCRLTLESAAPFAFSLPDLDAGMGSRTPVSSASIWIEGGDALRSNILNAAGSINDTVLSQGDLFSFNGVVGPRSERCGYQSAVNGRGVAVVGGGVAQVASVVWLAVKNMDGVAIVEKSTYGSRYNQSYVSSSNDAILTDYNADTDFSFRNTGSGALRICTYVSGDMLICDIYRSTAEG